jgi:hypothetical protein
VAEKDRASTPRNPPNLATTPEEHILSQLSRRNYRQFKSKERNDGLMLACPVMDPIRTGIVPILRCLYPPILQSAEFDLFKIRIIHIFCVKVKCFRSVSCLHSTAPPSPPLSPSSRASLSSSSHPIAVLMILQSLLEPGPTHNTCIAYGKRQPGFKENRAYSSA